MQTKPTDQRFIELVNLFVDNEISTNEGRELELALEGNAERQRVYDDYCRMQKACALLTEREEVPANVEQFRQRLIAGSASAKAFGWGRFFSKRATLGWSGMTAVATACVAVFFAMQNNVVVVDTEDCMFSLVRNPVEMQVGMIGGGQAMPFHLESNGRALGMNWDDADLSIDLSPMNADFELASKSFAVPQETMKDRWDAGEIESLKPTLTKPAVEMSAFSIGQ